MSPIVDENVHHADFLFESAPKPPVGLIPDEYANRRAFIRFAGGFNIDADDLTVRPKVLSPHFQAAAAINADFYNDNVTASKTLEMPVVYVEVVIPLKDPVPCLVSLEVFMEEIRSCIDILRSIRISWPPNSIAPGEVSVM
jgi:hypothetical protein